MSIAEEMERRRRDDDTDKRLDALIKQVEDLQALVASLTEPETKRGKPSKGE